MSACCIFFDLLHNRNSLSNKIFYNFRFESILLNCSDILMREMAFFSKKG